MRAIAFVWTLLGKRLGAGLVTLWVVLSITFIMIRLMPALFQRKNAGSHSKSLGSKVSLG